MFTRPRVTIAVLAVLALGVVFVWTRVPRHPLPPVATQPVPTPTDDAVSNHSIVGSTNSVANLTPKDPERRPSPSHVRMPASRLTEEERQDFEAKFTSKLKPEIDRWCKIYADHLPFDPKDVTADKFVERLGRTPDSYSYTFMVNGITIGVDDYGGKAMFSDMTTRDIKEAERIPKNPESPKPSSVSKDEVIRLLKEDSGKEYPPEQVIVSPTGNASAMNGGAYVLVGESVHAAYGPPPDYIMIFGPDGKLVNYGRWTAPNWSMRQTQPPKQ